MSVGEVWFGFEILKVVDPGEGRDGGVLAQGRLTWEIGPV